MPEINNIVNQEANEKVLETILNYASESKLKKVQSKINNYNLSLEKEINLIKSEVEKLGSLVEFGEKQEKILTIDRFKESIVKLKVNH